MSEQLADCPFCGGWAYGNEGGTEEVSNGDRVYFKPEYGCSSCGIYAEDAATWNRRPHKPQTAAVLAELVEVLTDPKCGDQVPGEHTCVVGITDREAFLREQGAL